MKKVFGIMTALSLVAVFALAGCQKQEGQQQGGSQPESAPTATTPAAPAEPEHK